MSKTTIKSFYYGSLVALILIAIFLPRGTTINNVSLKPDFSGEIGLILQPDDSSRELAEKRLPSYYRHKVEKNDYGFVVFYRYQISFDLSAVPEVSARSLLLRVRLPGTINNIEGGNAEEDSAVFGIKLGKDNNLTASSYALRWIWIIITLIIALLAISFYLLRRSIEKH